MSTIIVMYMLVTYSSFLSHSYSFLLLHFTNYENYRNIWGIHGGYYEEWRLVGCYAAWLL
jgi:hypothetical protein